MKIGALAGGTQPQPTGQQNPQIKAIDKQIAGIRKQMQELKTNKDMDAKLKEEKLKAMQDQITALEQQKAKIQAEARKPRAQGGQPKEQTNPDAAGGMIGEDAQKALVRMDTAVKTQASLGTVRAGLEGELRVAESKSFLRTPDPEQAAEVSGKLEQMSSSTIGKVREASEALHKQSAKTPDEEEDDEKRGEKKGSGTGRMEPGQFLDDKA